MCAKMECDHCCSNSCQAHVAQMHPCEMSDTENTGDSKGQVAHTSSGERKAEGTVLCDEKRLAIRTEWSGGSTDVDWPPRVATEKHRRLFVALVRT